MKKDSRLFGRNIGFYLYFKEKTGIGLKAWDFNLCSTMLNTADHNIFVLDGLLMTQIKLLKLRLTFSYSGLSCLEYFWVR